jgi:TonB-dependent receptor
LLLATLCLTPPARAQSAGTGTVSGRVYNPETGEYVRNARIRAAGTGEVAISEQGGFYQITNLPPGEATLVLSYAGFPDVTVKAAVAAGTTATVDINLPADADADTGAAPSASSAGTSASAGAGATGTTAAGTTTGTTASAAGTGTGADGDVVKLEAFTVTSDRSGQAKVIMEQRASMNIAQHVAADVFGDNTEGNIGEFLRNLPGVLVNTSEGEVTNINLGGLGAEYTAVTIDGVSLATVSAASNDSRAASFSAISLNSIDGLEISRTVSADMDANAPAGIINLRSKRAFENKGQKIVAQANLTLHSFAPTLEKELGPHDTRRAFKIRPGGMFQYSNAFSRRFGILLNVSESNIYSEESRAVINYNRTATASDPRPEVPQSFVFHQTARLNRRFASTLTLDWRATERLTLSLTGIYNYSRMFGLQRPITFSNWTTGAGGSRALVQGTDPTRSIHTIYGSAVIANPVVVSRMGQNITFTPKFEYRAGDFRLEGLFTSSEAKAWYDPDGREGAVRGLASPTAYHVLYNVSRGPGLTDADYKVTQTGGPDMAGASGFNFPKVYLRDGRKAVTKIRTARLDASHLTRFLLPIKWKAGLKMRNEKWRYRNDNELNLATYDGPLTLGDFATPYAWDSNIDGLRLTSLSGGSVFMPNLFAIGARYRAHPEEFTPVTTASNYYNANVENARNFKEDVNAAYLMGMGTWGRLIFQAGVRLEDTKTGIREIDAYSPEQTEAQGYGVTADGVADSVEGVEWQFLSRPRVHKINRYHDYFPSASIKYQILPRLDLIVAANKTIRRPAYYDATGVFLVNDDAGKISFPNRALKPERGTGGAVRLSYYFKGIGQLSASFYQTRLTNMIATSDNLTAADVGYDKNYPGYNEEYADYLFSTRTNSGAPVTVRSMELSYSQRLAFLGRAFRRLSVHLNYTRGYANAIKPMLPPHAVSTGFHYTYKKLTLWSDFNWTDDFPTSTTGYSLRRHRTQLDAGLGWNFGQGFMFGLNARNLTDAPYMHMQKVPPSPTVLQDRLRVGTTWTTYIKKTF